MKLKTPDFKKHIKKHGVTKARISEDWKNIWKGELLTFTIDLHGDLRCHPYDKTNFLYYKGTFEIVEGINKK